MHRLLTFLLILITTTAFAQDELYYEDHVYLSNIRSVQLKIGSQPTLLPVISMRASGPLILSFDDLDGDDKTYTYEIIHCDKDWNRSDLDEVEYMDGFNGEDIDQVDYSSGSLQLYTHYTLRLPNADLRWRISGNYLLVIYEDEGDRIPAITRRFMVTEEVLQVEASIIRPKRVGLINTHHEIDFEIRNTSFPIDRPVQEIEVVLMQNGRWDNARTGIRPKFVSGSALKFDYSGNYTFPALKEFRRFDASRLNFTSEGVHAIEVHDEGVDVLLEGQTKRSFENYHTYLDQNGLFQISSEDTRDVDTESEYVNVIFTLKSPTSYDDAELYVFGKCTDWALQEEFRLHRYGDQYYRGEAYLKQGVYDYIFVLAQDDHIDAVELEGSWRETENEYAILVYYREFGRRYDRLLAVHGLNSADQY